MLGSHRPQRLALALATIALAAVLVFAVARTLHTTSDGASAPTVVRTPARPTVDPFVMYLYSAHLPDTNQPMRPGETFTVTWRPDAGQPASGPPDPTVCTVALLGPFASRGAAQQVADSIHGGGPVEHPTSAIPVAFAAPTLTIDDRASMAQSSVVTLPGTLEPGYYVLDAFAEGPAGSSASIDVLAIQA